MFFITPSPFSPTRAPASQRVLWRFSLVFLLPSFILFISLPSSTPVLFPLRNNNRRKSKALSSAPGLFAHPRAHKSGLQLSGPWTMASDFLPPHQCLLKGKKSRREILGLTDMVNDTPPAPSLEGRRLAVHSVLVIFPCWFVALLHCIISLP